MVKIHRAPPKAGSGSSGPADLQPAFTYTDQQITRRSFSAYLGLVRNGSGILGSNDNFSQFEFVPDDLVAGGGSFELPEGGGIGWPDEYVAVNPDVPLRLGAYARFPRQAGILFTGLSAFDSDKQSIFAQQWLYRPNTLTTLTQDLKPGDMTIHVASTANWQQGGESYERAIIVWNYRNSRGYLYPPESYSRNYWAADGAGTGIYAPNSLTATEIPLLYPWPLAAVAAGTPVSNNTSGGTFAYVGAIAASVGSQWQYFSGKTAGLYRGGAREYGHLPQGTAFVKPIAFTTNGVPLRVNMLQLSEVIS